MKLSWPGWIWFQFVVPVLSSVMATAVAGIPFAIVWPPMTKQRAVFCLGVGVLWLVYAVVAQRRKLASDGFLPPYA